MRWRRDKLPTPIFLGFLGGLAVKDLGSIPGLGRSPGEGKSNPVHFLAWEIPWTEEPGGLQSIRSQESDMTE